MNKQKSGGGRSKQSGADSGSRSGEQDATAEKRGKEVAGAPKPVPKGGAKQKRKR